MNPNSQRISQFSQPLRRAAWTLLVPFALQALAFYAAEVSPAEKKAFKAAMVDAQTATQDEVSRKLLALVPGEDQVNSKRLHGKSISWEGEPGASRVLVVAFMSRASFQRYYEPYMDQDPYTLTKSLWVTVVPELKSYFMDNDYPPGAKRVKKALGLNPANDYEVLLEMWVDANAIFRPSPDPDTKDHEAEIATRVDDFFWVFPSDSNPFLHLDDSAAFVDHRGGDRLSYRQWFAANARTTYQMPDPDDLTTWGNPWTRLGYTYDWGKSGNGHDGVSEFMLRIDPEANGGELSVTLVRAVDCDTKDWNRYFRCGGGTAERGENNEIQDEWTLDQAESEEEVEQGWADSPWD
jgi:hypothetical protein